METEKIFLKVKVKTDAAALVADVYRGSLNASRASGSGPPDVYQLVFASGNKKHSCSCVH